MRKFYFFLIAALLLPVMAMAEGNQAVKLTKSNVYGGKLATLEIPYVGTVEESIPASKGISYSWGFWIKPATGYGLASSQFKMKNGNGMGMLAGFGTNEHTNDGQWQYGLGYDDEGNIQIIGSSNNGATQNGFSDGEIVGKLSLTDWNYVVFTVDNVNNTAALYVNGESVCQGSTGNFGMRWQSADMRDGDDNGKWPTFQFFSYRAQGSVDEIQIFSTALTADEVKNAMNSAYAVNSLKCLYTLDEAVEGKVGHFANQVIGGPDTDACTLTAQYSSYWAGSAMVYRSGSTPLAPTFEEGREIKIEDVTITIPETEGGSLTATAGETTYTVGSHTIQTQTILNVVATPAEGYALKAVYAKRGDNAVEIPNNTNYVVVANAELYGEFTNSFNALTVNIGEGAEVAFTRKGAEVTDLSNLLDGEVYNFTVAITDNTKRLVDVKLGDEVLEAVNGVYSFTSAANQTITVTTENKPYYAITIEQPAVGATLSALWGEKVINNGDQVMEGEEITLVATCEEGYAVRTWIVDGEATREETQVVNAPMTITAEIVEGAASCKPVHRDGSTTITRSSRGITGLTVTDGVSTITLDAYGTGQREIYIDNTDKELTVEPGATLTFTSTGSGTWMHTAIFADLDYNGLSAEDVVMQSPNLVSGGSDPYAGTWTFTVPATTAERRYTVRYMVDWDCNDPCLFGQANNDNGEYVCDFTLIVKVKRLEAPRNITIKANKAELGTVAFTNPASEETTLNTDVENVKAIATVNEEAENVEFVNWTDAAGNVLATTPEITYSAAADAELTANFGYAVTYTYNEDGGVVAASVNGNNVVSGAAVAAGATIKFEALPKSGYSVESFKVNGEAVTEDVCEVTVEGPINVEVTFAEASYTLIANVTGKGTVKAGTEMDEDTMMPAGNVYENGSVLTLNEEIMIFLIPGEGESLISAEAVCGDQTLTTEDFEDVEVAFVALVTVTDNLTVTAEFSGESAIDGIEADDANAPVEFYNLQGVRVNSENLVPGIYVRRQGSKAVKVYVTK